jgi:hypothetical protein
MCRSASWSRPVQPGSVVALWRVPDRHFGDARGHRPRDVESVRAFCSFSAYRFPRISADLARGLLLCQPALVDRAPSPGRVPFASGFVPTMHRATPGTRTLPSFSNTLTFAMAFARIRSRAGSSTC